MVFNEIFVNDKSGYDISNVTFVILIIIKHVQLKITSKISSKRNEDNDTDMSSSTEPKYVLITF